MGKCIICGDNTSRPIVAALYHFRLYEGGNWQWMRGNMQMSGRWRGFWSTMYLVCPLLNTLRFWKYRKATLQLADGKPLESAFDEKGCAIKSSEQRGTDGG